MRLKMVTYIITSMAYLSFSGCMMNDKDLVFRSYGNLEEKNISESEEEATTVQEYFIVAELKSVSDKPTKLLEFKEKRFIGNKNCELWINKNFAEVSNSLRSKVLEMPMGYFIDSIKCRLISDFNLESTQKQIDI
jgi:hypothetical protein